MSDPPPPGPVTFDDAHRRVSALVTRHRGERGWIALVYHDAPSVAAAMPVLDTIAAALVRPGCGARPSLLLEAGMPEHRLERFVYAAVRLRRRGGCVRATAGDVIPAALVARLCGITGDALDELEQQVVRVHRPHGCTFVDPAARPLPTLAPRGHVA